jgi:hypothetical protein
MSKGVLKGHRTALRRTVAAILSACVVLVGALVGAAAASADPAADCQLYVEPCLLPFPNDLFTKPDSTSATGRRVDLSQAAMPTNTVGQQVSVARYNRSDGFSPGSSIIIRVPGLDNQAAFDQTDPVRLTDMSQTYAPDAPIVVIDAATGQRALIWAELDSNAGDPAHTTLLIHPGKNLIEGHRYVVGLRDLKNADGQTLAAPDWFARFRDDRPLLKSQVHQRERYGRIFKALKDAGIDRKTLYMAWDFTVASRRSLTSPMLSIRDDAFGQLGDTDLADTQIQGQAPPFNVSGVTDFASCGSDGCQSGESDRLLRRVTGTFTVPCYLATASCTIGGGFNYSSADPDATPAQQTGNVGTAQFDCIIPRAAEGSPARASLYGHGLLGSRTEVGAGNVQDMAAEHDFVFCATDWWGLASGDIAFDISALLDINRFPAVADRLQQGVLNTLLLGRLMANPGGFASDEAFQANGNPLFDTSHLYYDGNSQGGIMGGITTAVAPDYTRAVLGVTGMDYGGILLQRSTDFTSPRAPFGFSFADVLYGRVPGGGYTDSSIHPLVLDLMQQLWDRGEADGYAAHMTSDPLPDTPAHEVLMQVAYGDHQVSQYAAAVEARTIGASVHVPALDLPARSQDVNLFYGVPAIPSYPFEGSAIVIWDDGPGLVPPPPVTNTPPTVGRDPHGDVRATVAARVQKSAFLDANGSVVDVCGGLPCHTDVYTP